MDSHMEQEISLADMAASYRRAGITDLVLDACCAQAITRNVSMPTIGGTICERFCGLDCGINQHNFRISQN
jgi:ketopantoate hydroxymethyltransferase